MALQGAGGMLAMAWVAGVAIWRGLAREVAGGAGGAGGGGSGDGGRRLGELRARS